MATETWKKMAEAFGRAMNERMKDGKTAKIINSSEIADKANTPGIYKDKDMDLIHAYRRGQDEGEDNYLMGITRAQEASGKAFPRRSDISRQISRTEDENSSRRLEEAFDKALDEAAENHGYKKWKEESKDMPLDDGFKGDLHDVNREDAVQRSREEIIKALQQNTDRDVTDVLRDFGYIIEE